MRQLTARFTARQIEIFVVTIIVLIAAGLRLYKLDQLPPGLHYDEAFNATMALRVQSGVERPIFFSEDLTEEPLAIYLAAAMFSIGGSSPWSLRLVSAMAGIVTVLAFYFLARQIFLQRWTAWLATFILAILYWHLNFSRLGMEPILTPMTLTLAFVFLWHGFYPHPNPLPSAQTTDRRGGNVPSPVHLGLANGGGLGWGSLILGGFFLATTQYTYKAALFVPILVAAFFGVEIFADRKFLRENWRGLVLTACVAILFFAPLGLYFAAHPDQFLERPGAVTATTTPTTIIDNALKVAGMFFVRGDDNPRSNLPARPVLDPFLAIGFIVGLIVCVVRIRQRESRLMLLWLVIMSTPSIITDFAPHFGRDIGAIPAIVLIVANGFGSVIQKLRDTDQAINRRPLTVNRLLLAGYCLLFVGLVFSVGSTINDYFFNWGARTGLFDSFDVGILNLAQYLRAQPGSDALYVSPLDRSYYTFDYGLSGRAARSFDGRNVLVVPPNGIVADYGIITRDDTQSLNQLRQIFPQGRVIDSISDFVVQPYASIFRATGAAQIAPRKSINAQIGDAIKIIGYDETRDGDSIYLTIYWRSIAATQDNFTAFAQLIGATNPATQSPVWAQDDAQPGRGSYPTSHWQAGETIIDHYRLTLPIDLPRGEYQIEVGMYNLETGARVPMFDPTGARMENDRVIFETSTLP